MAVSDFLEILAFFGGLAALSGYVPQVVHLIRVKDSTGMSFGAWYVWAAGTASVFAYAVSIRNRLYIFLDGLDTLLCVIILILIYKYRRRKHETLHKLVKRFYKGR